MSLAALLIINHKHTLRQTRLEQRDANRVQAQVMRDASKAESALDQKPAQVEAEYRDQPEGTAMSGAQPLDFVALDDRQRGRLHDCARRTLAATNDVLCLPTAGVEQHSSPH